jgi:Family of unknown function (DUF6056)
MTRGRGDAAPAERAARVALLGFLVALVVVHGVVAWLSPLQGDDWGVGRHGLGAQLGDVLAGWLARSTLLHALVSPLVSAALVAGVFTLAMRRLPDPGRWRDVLGVALASCLLWIALPRAGAMWFHRSYVAAQLYGAALVVWFVAAFRARWTLAGRAWPIAMAAAGLVAGLASRQLAVMAVVGAAVAVRRAPRAERRAWMVPGLAGAAIGLVVGFVHAPWAELGRVFGRLEPNLIALAPLLRAGGPVIALVAILVLVRQLRAAGGSQAAPAGDGAPDAGETLAWLVAWLALGVAGLLGPRSIEAVMLPAAIALTAGALPLLRWLAEARLARWLLVALVVGVHLLVWTRALTTYAALGGAFRERMAVIERTPPGQVARVRTYATLLPDFWSPGEDWAELALRSSLADRWGLAGIDLAPAFRQLERSPDLAFALEADGVADHAVAEAAPERWARELAPARRQFAAAVERLQAAAGHRVAARLRATNIEFAARNGRPVYAAWTNGTTRVAPEASRGAPDVESHMAISIPPGVAVQFPEAWQVGPGGADTVRCATGRCDVVLQRAEPTALVLCSVERCLAVDAWVPRF